MKWFMKRSIKKMKRSKNGKFKCIRCGDWLCAHELDVYLLNPPRYIVKCPKCVENNVIRAIDSNLMMER